MAFVYFCIHINVELRVHSYLYCISSRVLYRTDRFPVHYCWCAFSLFASIVRTRTFSFYLRQQHFFLTEWVGTPLYPLLAGVLLKTLKNLPLFPKQINSEPFPELFFVVAGDFQYQLTFNKGWMGKNIVTALHGKDKT